MADYNKATNFTAKDGLPSGNAGKIVKGTEIDTELTAISSAIASKSNINSPTFTGTPAAPTASAGTNTTQVATTAFVTAADVAERTATTTLTNKTLTSPTISGGTITGITDLTVADGGTGVSTLAANAVLLGNGTSALQTVAPSTSGNVLKSNGTTWTSAAPAVPSGLGLNGETWHDVTSTRTSGTSYTAPAYPIMIIVSTGNGTSQGVTVVVGGVTVSAQTGGGSGYTQGVMGTAIVPANATYSVTFYGNSPKWVELY
jgi:hypothetical protein